MISPDLLFDLGLLVIEDPFRGYYAVYAYINIQFRFELDAVRNH